MFDHPLDLRGTEVTVIGGTNGATHITMRTVPTKTVTRITLSDIAYDSALADVLFESP